MQLHKISTLALVVAAACHANAQDASQLEETVVHGRFQQSLVDRIPIAPQELPFTLNVVDRDFLDDRNFTRPIEALTTLPNVILTEDRQGSGGIQFLSRGFHAPILVDNRVQNEFRGAGSRDSAFVERYEVLKGPATIASGPVGGGGIINTVTKTPEQERAVALKFRADQFGTLGGEFDVNAGELNGSDAVLFRISGAYRDFKFDADEVGRKTLAIRPVAIINAGPDTSVKVSYAYTKHDVSPQGGFPLMSDGSIPNGFDTDTFAGYVNANSEVEDTLANVEINHDFLDNLKLTVRGSKQETDLDYQNTSGLYNYGGDAGFDGGLYGYPQSAKTESEATFVDVQLAYTANFWGQDQNFVVGVANDDRSFERFFNSYTYDGPYSLATIDQPRYGDGGSGELQPFTIYNSKLKSVLAEAALRPSDKVTIVAGIRYDQLEQETLNYRRGREISAPFDDNELTMRVGVSVDATDNLHVYASYAQAFIPQFGLRRSNSPVAAETSESYEAGIKGSALDGRLTFQTGVFHTVRKDVPLSDPENTPTEFYVVSAGQVEVQGVELSTVFNPTEALSLTLNVGYSDIDVSEGEDQIQKPVFPEITGSFYLSYEVQSGMLQGLSMGGGLRHMGEREGPRVDWDSYTVADLNFGYSINEQLGLSFDILNVNDEKYVENTTVNTVNRLTGAAVLGAPRTAVLTLDWKL